MCVKFTSDIKVFKKDRIVHKEVSDIRMSYFIPVERVPQIYCNNLKYRGDYFKYEKGKTVRSNFDDTFGIYCYRNRKFSISESRQINPNWISILCKKGTKYRLTKCRDHLGNYTVPGINIEEGKILS